jgi:hypothetical protein
MAHKTQNAPMLTFSQWSSLTTSEDRRNGKVPPADGLI